MGIEKLLRELRLMKGQPGHRFYMVAAVVVLVVLGNLMLSVKAIALLSWFWLQ